jgi:hypothetical protein
MNLRPSYAALALASAVTLTACTSSTSGQGQTGGSGTLAGPSGSASGGSASGGSSAGTPGGKPTDAAGLGALMQSAVATIKTAHISLDVNAAGQALTGSGDEKLSAGKLVAMNLSEALPQGAGSIEIIIVGGKTYAKLPSSLNTSGKPYLLVTPTSSNAVVKQLAASLDSALSSASLGSVSAFIAAADSVKLKGTQSIDGVSTTHYSVVVNIAKLPATLPGKDALSSSGLATLPLELYIDDQGRPVQVTEDFQVQGQKVSTTVKVSNYDKPVSITAPPANQVGTG